MNGDANIVVGAGKKGFVVATTAAHSSNAPMTDPEQCVCPSLENMSSIFFPPIVLFLIFSVPTVLCIVAQFEVHIQRKVSPEQTQLNLSNLCHSFDPSWISDRETTKARLQATEKWEPTQYYSLFLHYERSGHFDAGRICRRFGSSSRQGEWECLSSQTWRRRSP